MKRFWKQSTGLQSVSLCRNPNSARRSANDRLAHPLRFLYPRGISERRPALLCRRQSMWQSGCGVGFGLYAGKINQLPIAGCRRIGNQECVPRRSMLIVKPLICNGFPDQRSLVPAALSRSTNALISSHASVGRLANSRNTVFTNSLSPFMMRSI